MFLKGYLHPSFANVREYAWQCVVTVCIALWGTRAGGDDLGAARACWARGTWRRTPWSISPPAGVMDVLRAVNEFVFALMFVTAVGLGPFAGMLALGLHTGGVLGKLLSETIEAIDPGQMEGVAAVGAPRLHVIAFGVVPQVMPNFLSYILLRFESDIRSASVIGMVGWRRHRLLPVGHDPGVQRPRGGHGDPAHRGHGDVRGRGVVPDPPGVDLTALPRSGKESRMRVLKTMAARAAGGAHAGRRRRPPRTRPGRRR